MTKRSVVLLIGLLGLQAMTGCATTRPVTRTDSGPETSDQAQVGMASFYHARFHGRRTASGALYDQRELTAAHRTLPFGTKVRVTNLRNHRSVVLTVTDRGPFIRGRIIDVSRRAARELDFVRRGTARVRVEVVSPLG